MSEQLNISWSEFHRASIKLAKLCMGNSYQQIVAIARGGLIPAGIVARELNIRNIETLCLTSYVGHTQGEMHILKALEGDGEGLLIIDDLVDSGKTAEIVRKMLPKATIAVVYAKPQGQPFADIYAETAEQDTWLNFPWDTSLAYHEPLIKE